MTIRERFEAIAEALDEKAVRRMHERGEPRSWWQCWPALLAAAIVLAIILGASAQMGLNEEMTGPIYLHPYELLRLDAATPRWSECSGRFFAQHIRPVFGLCIDGRPLPLLYMLYVPVWSYWPLWWIGTHVPGHVPILVHVVPAIVAGTMLWLLALQVFRHAGVGLATMAVGGLAMFPFATLYGSLYLYEVLPITCLFGVWWLLDRYNRHGGTATLCLAALVAGFACHQKATAVLVYVPCLAAYAAVFGFRRLTASKLAAATAAGLLLPLFGISLNLAYAAMVQWTQQVGQTTPQISWLQGIAALSYFVFGALPSRQFSLDDIIRTVLFVVLIGYCVHLIRRYFRGLARREVETFAAFTLIGTLAGIVVAYRYNPTSIPSFPLLPFVVILIAGLWREAAEWLAVRLGAAKVRVVLPVAFTLVALVVMVVRWPAALQVSREMMGYPSFSDQAYAKDWLLERNITQPLMLTFEEKGTLELLSEGRIRPTYFNEKQCQPVEPTLWSRVLTATRDRQVDILVPAPYFADQQMARQCARGAAKELAAVLRTSDRQATETPLTTPGHSWDFMLFSVAPAGEGT